MMGLWIILGVVVLVALGAAFLWLLARDSE